MKNIFQPASILTLLAMMMAFGASLEPYSPTITTADPITLQTIPQQIPLKKCHVKTDIGALYICEDQALIFKKTKSSPRFSELIDQINPVIDGDISIENVIIINPSKIILMTSSDSEQQAGIEEELPILVRINTKENYALAVILARILDTQLNNTNSSATYVIHSFLLAEAPHFHHIRFPTKDLDFEIKDSSFKDAVIYHDSLFGHEYFITALEQGWIYVFKSLFEDPQLELIKTFRVDSGYEIKQLVLSGNMLFTLLENSSNNQLMLEIYTLKTPSDFNLQKECSINIGGYDKGALPFPQVRARNIKNTFIVLVNFPGSHILTYAFQRPENGIFPLQCPTESNKINYGEGEGRVKIGYSFDYVIIEDSDGMAEQGVLVTPFSNDHENSYYFTYCMPNFYLTPRGNCMPCKEGYGKGGISSTCESCNKIINANYEIVPGQDPLFASCKSKCKTPDKYGKDCQEDCQSYLTASGVTLPRESFAFVNNQGFCGFKCQKGSPEEFTGTCLATERESEAIIDNCAQLTDCMNCTMSQSCLWCGGSCKLAKQCDHSVTKKKDISRDYLLRAVHCNVTQPPCGKQTHDKHSGNFSFAEDIVLKNQVCLWSVSPQFKEYKEVTINVHNPNSPLQIWDNPPNLLVRYCVHQLYMEVCWTKKLPVQDGASIKVRGSEILFFAWIEESIFANATGFRIEYNMNSIPNFFAQLIGFINILARLALSCLMFVLVISWCQKFTTYQRRRRLMRDLQSLELFSLFGNDEAQERVVHAEDIMRNNAIVSRVIYRTGDSEFDQTECPICLESFASGENLAKLCCKHLFHGDCINDWIKAIDSHQQIKCPVCNRVLI